MTASEVVEPASVRRHLEWAMFDPKLPLAESTRAA